MNLPSSPALVAVLASGAEPHDKAIACQQLAIVGGPEAVPALAALLGDDKLSDYCRSGLEAIADPSAGEALRKALPQLQGAQLAGAIDSLGVRRETAAVPDLLAVLRDPARGAAAEVLSALGKIANGDAITTLRATLSDGPADLRIPAAHAALAAAGFLTGDTKRELLDAVRSAQVPEYLKTVAAALRNAPVSKTTKLFDGKSFDGWEGDLNWFRIAEETIIAGSMTKAIPQNEFLCSTREFGDFELRLQVRLSGGKGNGGIQFRSQRVPDSREMAGYQADLATGYWGGIYDESRRRTFLGTPPDQAAIARILKPDGWNAYVIRCEGPHIRLWLNGTLTADFTETDPAIPRRGRLGLQIHAGEASEASYKDIEIEELNP